MKKETRDTEILQPSETNVRHGALFWKCKNYEEYAIACDIEGLTHIWDKATFEDLKTRMSEDEVKQMAEDMDWLPECDGFYGD